MADEINLDTYPDSERGRYLRGLAARKLAEINAMKKAMVPVPVPGGPMHEMGDRIARMRRWNAMAANPDFFRRFGHGSPEPEVDPAADTEADVARKAKMDNMRLVGGQRFDMTSPGEAQQAEELTKSLQAAARQKQSLLAKANRMDIEKEYGSFGTGGRAKYIKAMDARKRDERMTNRLRPYVAQGMAGVAAAAPELEALRIQNQPNALQAAEARLKNSQAKLVEGATQPGTATAEAGATGTAAPPQPQAPPQPGVTRRPMGIMESFVHHFNDMDPGTAQMMAQHRREQLMSFLKQNPNLTFPAPPNPAQAGF